MTRRYALRLIGALVSLPLLWFAASASAQDDHPAQKLVVDSTTRMLEVLRNDAERIKSDPAYLNTQVEDIVVPAVDFETMTKLAVGKFWRQADTAQQEELVSQFRQLLLNTYTGALTEYSGEQFEFQPFRPEERADRAVVRSEFRQAAGGNVPILYKLRDKDGWLIYDIEVNNVSLVTSYRTAFANEIDQGGIDGLLATLKERNAG